MRQVLTRTLLPVARQSLSASRVKATPKNGLLIAARPLSTSLRRREDDANNKGSFSTTQEDIAIDYPEHAKGDDVGHRTIDGSLPVGRHNQRTLASFSCEGKVCVVTGAARGLGNLFARTFAESGSNSVVLLDLDQKLAEEAAQELEDWFVSHGQAKPDEIDAIGIGCDVSNEESVKAAFQKVVDHFGRIDVLVNSAGIVHNYPATDYPTEKIALLNAVNINGSLFCAREAAKHMMAQKIEGSIVLVGSMSGSIVNVPQPQAPYNASKAAVRHMAASLAVEWAPQNIRVNCLSPGYMATSLTRIILDNNPALEEKWTSLTPMGRVGEPEDLKGAIVYLASDASKFTTGTDLKVDGGYCLT